MNNRFSSTRDLTMVNRSPGIGVPHTNVKPTAEELRLRALEKRRKRDAEARRKAAEARGLRKPIDWPPGFVSSIRVDKHGRMV